MVLIVDQLLRVVQSNESSSAGIPILGISNTGSRGVGMWDLHGPWTKFATLRLHWRRFLVDSQTAAKTQVHASRNLGKLGQLVPQVAKSLVGIITVLQESQKKTMYFTSKRGLCEGLLPIGYSLSLHRLWLNDSCAIRTIVVLVVAQDQKW